MGEPTRDDGRRYDAGFALGYAMGVGLTVLHYDTTAHAAIRTAFAFTGMLALQWLARAFRR